MYRDLHSARVPCGSILSSKVTTTRKRPLNLRILAYFEVSLMLGVGLKFDSHKFVS